MIGQVHALAGYLAGYASSKTLVKDGPRDGVLAALLGVAPDIDFFSPLPFGTPFGHHGVTHSPVLLILVFVPVMIKYRGKAVPYFLALMSHVVTDFVDNTVPLLVPVSWEEFGLRLSLSPSSLPLALILQLLIVAISGYCIAKGSKDFSISMPERYDKMATLTLVTFILASPLLIDLMYDESTWAYSGYSSFILIINSTLWLSSSLLVLFVLGLNSNFIIRRFLKEKIGKYSQSSRADPFVNT